MLFRHFLLPDMHGLAITKDLNYHLDILGQLSPLPKIYTQICFCFSLTDAYSHSAIINNLTNGLDRLSASFPWLAGQVANEGSVKDTSGIFKFKALEKIPRRVVKDLSHDPSIPTIDALRRASFPFSMLGGTIIAHHETLPGSPRRIRIRLRTSYPPSSQFHYRRPPAHLRRP